MKQICQPRCNELTIIKIQEKSAVKINLGKNHLNNEFTDFRTTHKIALKQNATKITV